MVKVKTILKTEENAYMGKDKITFQDQDNRVIYTFRKVEEGKDYEGEVKADKGGNLQLKGMPFSSNGQNNTGWSSKPKEFKADPVKNASIERQVALKAAVDVVSAKLPLMDKVPETKDIALAVEVLAESFDKFLKSDKPVKSDDAEVQSLLDSATEIDVDEIQFGDEE